MNRGTGHVHADSRRRVRVDAPRRSTRRAFLVAAAAWPLVTWTGALFAQSKQAPVLIGWLNVGSRGSNEHLLAAFKEGLAALGWKEGSNVVFEERWADGQTERLQPLAEELAARKPAVIVAAPLRSAGIGVRYPRRLLWDCRRSFGPVEHFAIQLDAVAAAPDQHQHASKLANGYLQSFAKGNVVHDPDPISILTTQVVHHSSL